MSRGSEVKEGPAKDSKRVARGGGRQGKCHIMSQKKMIKKKGTINCIRFC